jgi:dephospho-CoA kinase
VIEVKIEKISVLTEDKSVSFGGVDYPKFGWCVIVCGGSGSGKSSVVKNLVHIQAKTLDVDEVKRVFLKQSDIDGDKIVTKSGKEYYLDDIDGPYDMSNPKYTEFIHKVTKPLARSKKNTFLKSLESSDPDRLPNVLFDITGKNKNDFSEIISTMKPLGYKISVVWVFAEIETALQRNANRDRVVPEKLVTDIYFDVLRTLTDMFNDKSFMSNIDEVCVVMNDMNFDTKDKNQLYDYTKIPNVYRIKSKDDVVRLPNRIASAINRAKRKAFTTD